MMQTYTKIQAIIYLQGSLRPLRIYKELPMAKGCLKSLFQMFTNWPKRPWMATTLNLAFYLRQDPQPLN